MDFDGDGKFDLISGSYDPGELYLFRGLGGGKFAAREVIKDKGGKPVLRVPNQKDRVESFGSWVAMVDWDDDGKPDLLVGGFDGTMFVRRNEGSRERPAFAAENEWVTVGKKRLRVPGGAHANPVIADWDGDGLWDIVTGSGDGGVYWYRNVGKRGAPAFAAPVALVPKHEGIGYSELLDAGQEPKPGIRSQIAVTDYDGDGKLDVLLGDFCTYLKVKKDLTPAQRKEFDAVRDRQDKIGKKLRDAMDELQARWKKEMAGVPKADWNTPENQEKWQKMYKGMRESAGYKREYAEYQKSEKELARFVMKPAKGRDSPDEPHGYVWLFRRR
ncbi:MAG: FG-GAP-like repeat-containing protein [Gemmataceae bacterium]